MGRRRLPIKRHLCCYRETTLTKPPAPVEPPLLLAERVVGGATETAAEMAAGIVQWLAVRQMPSGAIRGDGELASPSDHYAHSFAALAMGLMAEQDQSLNLWHKAEKSVGYSLSINASVRRKQEFNSLALLMLQTAAGSSKLAPESLRKKLLEAVSHPEFLY